MNIIYMRTYNYGLSMNLIHSIHLLFGSWMVWLGYCYLKGKVVSGVENIILLILGLVMTLYQSWLWYKSPKTIYHYNAPGWFVNLMHILSGLLLIYIGLSEQSQNILYDLFGIAFIILGSMAGLYHLHIWALTKHDNHNH